MHAWRGLDDLPRDLEPTAVAIGVFDGVHRGHAALIGRLLAVARTRGLRPVVVTFDPDPMAVLRPDVAPPKLVTTRRRIEILAELLAEVPGAGVLVLSFTRELASMPPEEFVDSVLVRRLQAQAVVVGENFRFGSKAAGDVALLEALGPARGFVTDAVRLAAGADARWSSTWVRERVEHGDVVAAAHALGRLHRVEGVVVRGDQRGREIGYPTANLGFGTPGSPEGTASSLEDAQETPAVPADGVYAGWLVRDDGSRLPAAISIGTNPTFDGVGRRVEAYVLDRDDLELYGERVAFDFLARLRDTVRFDSVDALVAQMADDVADARRLTGAPDPSAPTPDAAARASSMHDS